MAGAAIAILTASPETGALTKDTMTNKCFNLDVVARLDRAIQ
jgi:hypothetical protein